MEKIVNSKEYDYLKRQRIISELCSKYSFIKRKTIGKSCSGKDITALKIGDAAQYCLMAAAFHGTERITSTVLLMFIEELAQAISQEGYIAGLKMPRALRGRGIIAIPCVNPDGCDITLLGKNGYNSETPLARLIEKNHSVWNANLRGVDINHNFNADWKSLRQLETDSGIYGPSPTRYGGRHPESEPETVALTTVCRENPIRHVLAFHSQGEVIYWSYGRKQPPRSRKMAEIMSTASGYALDVPIGIANGGGFKDWFITEFNRPGFTIELGKGENPLPAEWAENIYLKAREMITLAAIM